MGGAQAVVALACGTESVEPVDVVVGPGNAWVQEAKRWAYGRVGIDGLAGPSELMLIAGHDTELEWAALDLCAQAEHGADSPLIASAVEEAVLDDLQQEVESAAAQRPSVADAPLALVHVPDLADAVALANDYAPEHLQLMSEDAYALAAQVRTRGMRVRRTRQRDRVRRLRGRLQPRPADRRDGALRRPAGTGRVSAPNRECKLARPCRRSACALRGDAGARRGASRPRRVRAGARVI